MMKVRAWSKNLKQFFYVDNSFSISLCDTGNLICMWSSDGIVDEFKADEVMTGLGMTDNEDREIYWGDIYHMAGYGSLHLESNSDLITLMEGMSESDLGDYLGNRFENPELLTTT